MASYAISFKILARSSPLELLEIGKPWKASPASTTKVAGFLARSSSMTAANLASPITPFSSTIRP